MNRFRHLCFGITLISMMAAGAAVRAQSPEPAATPQATPPTSAVPRSVPFNGQLSLPSGEVRAGAVLLTFGLYTDQTDGTPLWTEQHQVTLDQDGRYSVILGSASKEGLPAEAFAAGTPRWLGVQADGDKEQPRFMLLSVPYALKAGDADTVAGKPVSDFVLSSHLTESVKTTLKEEGYPPKASTDPSNPTVSTVGRIPKFIDTVNGTGDSNIFQDGSGNIGIGTVTPAGPLNVVGSGTYKTLFMTGAHPAGAGFTVNSTFAGGRQYTMASLASGAAATPGSFVLYDEFIGDYRLFVSPIGNVGLGPGFGVTPPCCALQVIGNTQYQTLHVSGSNTIGSSVVIKSTGAGGHSYNLVSGGPTATGGAGSFSVYDETAGLFRMMISSTGNVGIGTNTPGQKLDVAGNINVTGNINAKYQDVAEWVETAEPIESGTVVIVDPLEPNRVQPSPKAYDTRVAGAVSKQPGLILGEKSDSKEMIAQSGRVRIKVDAKYGAIRIGDLLVTSPTPGYAMKSKPIKVAGQSMHRPGTLLGKALEALPNGKGEILVLLTLQ